MLGVFADTKWEHPKTYAHIEKMKALYNVDIKTIHSKHQNGDNVQSQILARGDFPNDRVRFCTGNLKARPLYKHALKYAEKNRTLGDKKFRLLLGLRVSESLKRKEKYDGFDEGDLVPSEVMLNGSLKFDKHYILNLAILRWTDKKVFDYLGNEVNPLYAHGFKRVGCFPCIASASKRGLARVYNFDAFGASQKKKVMALENAIGKKHYPSNTGQFCMFCTA